LHEFILRGDNVIEPMNAVEQMPTDEQNGEPSSVADESSPAMRPQLRLHHFFALTAVAAVLLAINGPQQDYWSNTDFQPPKLVLTLLTAWGVIYVLLIAVAVTAVAYGIAWQRKGLVFFDQPGHWLLVEIAIAGLFALMPSIAYRWLFSSMKVDDPDFSMTAMVLVSLSSLVTIIALPLALNIYIGVKKCHETRWSLVFYMKAVGNLLLGVGALVVIAVLLVAANRDRRERIARDASHWCGVWVQLAYSVLYFASAIVGVVNMFHMMSRM
jgi:hypothetical protein